MEIAALEEVLAYRNRFVVERFVDQFSVPTQAAEEIFQDMLRMLWLMAVSRVDRRNRNDSVPAGIVVYREMNVIDEMWHAFILFSREYTDFCQRFFGFYLHHVPTTSDDRHKEKNAFTIDPERHRQAKREEVRRQCYYTAERLGAPTLKKWFQEYPARFPAFVSKTAAPMKSSVEELMSELH